MEINDNSFPNLFSKKRAAILLIVILAAAALRIYGFSGYVGLDDAEYARFAHRMVDGTFHIGTYDGPPVFPLRMGIILPAALSFKLFGISEWSMVMPSFIISLMSLLLVYVLAGHLFGFHAGLIAASLWAILPADLDYNATKLVPDLPAAFFASLAVGCILLLVRSRAISRPVVFFGGMFAGMLLGLSWLCKETLSYLSPFFIALLVLTIKEDPKRNVILWAGVAFALLGILLGETVVYHNLTGDWLFRMHEVQRNHLLMKDGLFTEGSRWGWPQGGSYYKALLKRLFVIGPRTIFLNIQFLYLPLVGVLASLYAFYWKEKSFLVPALWLLTLCFMFNFSTSHFAYYAPLALFERYLYPICFPAVILAGGFFNKLLFEKKENMSHGNERERFFWGATLAIFLGVVAGYQTLDHIRYAKVPQGWAPEGRIVSILLKPSDRIYTDVLNLKSLEFFWKYPGKSGTIDFEGMKSAGDIPQGSLVLIHQRAIEWLEINAGMWLTKNNPYEEPEFVKNRPSSWKVIWQNSNAALYRVE